MQLIINKPTVLVVDDNIEHLKSLLKSLEKANFRVLIAKSGKSTLMGIKYIKPDIILLDVMMPDMDGFETCRHLKANDESKDIPIIFLTALTETIDKVKGFKLGAVDYLTKPVQVEEVLARLNTHLTIHNLQKRLNQQNQQLKQEIAKRQQIEEDNRKFSSAVEQSANVILITSLDGTIEFVNPAFSTTTGYSYSEAMGQNPSILLNSGKQSSEFYKNLWATIHQGKVWQGEMLNKRKDGELYWDFTTISPIKDQSGKTTHYVAIKEDITKSKQYKEQLEKQNQELQLKNVELELLTQKLADVQKENLFHLNKAYERFVPHQFLSLLDKKSILDVQLGDQVEKEMTVLFSDIRDFTTVSEKMTPQENFDFINTYLGQMEPIIHQYQGIIDKYIGDAVMALFDSANNAVNGSIAMLKRLVQYNQILQTAGFKPLEIGIGLNTGQLMLGTIGGQNRMDGTVISDAVNLASRVEDLTKIYGAALLITEDTYVKLDDPLQYHLRVIDAVKVKGKSEEVTVYEIYDADEPENVALKDQTRNDFEEGFVLYHWEEFNDACPFFENVLQVNKNDTAALTYLKRCKYFQKYGVPGDWEEIDMTYHKILQ